MTTHTHQPLSIQVTPTAAKKVRHFAEKQGLSDQFGLKVAVKGGG